MSKRMIYILVFFVVMVIGLEVALPTLVSELVVQGMMNVTESDHISAVVDKHPALMMLGGKFDTINISAQNVKTGRVEFAEMQTVLNNVQIDMGKLFSRRQIEIQSVGDIDVRAVVTQEELARYLNQAVKGIKNAEVIVTHDKIRASSDFSLGGFANVTVGLEGKIVGDGQKIKFVTERFFINNMMTGNIAGATLTEIPLVDLNKLPFRVGVRSIFQEQGRVIVQLDNHM